MIMLNKCIVLYLFDKYIGVFKKGLHGLTNKTSYLYVQDEDLISSYYTYKAYI